MALAIRMQTLVDEGHVTDYAELARLGHVTRARVTQIMNLLHLAPDIQEEVLFLPKTEKGRDPIMESDMRPICAIIEWGRQRNWWKNALAQKEPAGGNSASPSTDRSIAAAL